MKRINSLSFVGNHHRKFQFTSSWRLYLKIFLVGCIIINLALVIYPLRNKYLSTDYWQHFSKLKQTYLDSQYATKKAKWVRDEVAYSYAGGALIKGENPVFVVPDAPPLGKYLIGLSALLFNNENIISLISGLLSLYLLYLVGKQVLKSEILALLPPFFLSFEPLFKNQFVFTPLFDTIQLVFLLLFFYFFNKGLREKYIRNFIFAILLIGCFISTKFFVSGITIVAACFIVLLIKKDIKRLFVFIITLPLSIVVLLSSYLWVFAYGYQFNRFLGIQKWIFLYHQGQLGHAFSVWPLIILNKWYVWFGNTPVLSDSQWMLAWPIITIISLLTIVFYITKKRKKTPEIEILMAWTVCYFLFLCIGQVSTRYFIILIPVLYLISVYGIRELFQKKFLLYFLRHFHYI